MTGKRFFRRSRSLRIPILIEKADGSRSLGFLVSLGPDGVGLLADAILKIGESVNLNTIDQSLINLQQFDVRIRWHKENGSQGTYTYGGSLDNLSSEQKALLAIRLPNLYPRQYQAHKKLIAGTLKAGIGLFIPIIFLLGLKMDLDRVWFVSYLGIFAVTSLRIWETFLTSKDKQSFKDSDDWTIAAVIFYYVLMLIAIAVEVTFIRRPITGWWTILGLGIYIGAFLFRLYCMRTMGENWRIHILEDGAESSVQQTLVKNGPYRYLRHPIYAAVIAELVAIPLMFGAFASLLFVSMVNIPLQVLRSRIEEENLLKRYGAAYAKYMREVGGLIPAIFSQGKGMSEKRNLNYGIEANDRRQAR